MKACVVASFVLFTVGLAALGADVFAQAAQAPAPKPNSGAAPHVAIAKKAAGQEHLALFNNICTPPPPIQPQQQQAGGRRPEGTEAQPRPQQGQHHPALVRRHDPLVHEQQVPGEGDREHHDSRRFQHCPWPRAAAALPAGRNRPGQEQRRDQQDRHGVAAPPDFP